VTKASLLLRLARALNLGRGATASKTRIRIQNGEVNLELIASRKTGLDLELWAVEKEKDYFREVFGRELSAELA
jgi:exopolyphosphatase/guanosine-5'-triphosphate,3'-diphosphate pyrophosphatase